MRIYLLRTAFLPSVYIFGRLCVIIHSIGVWVSNLLAVRVSTWRPYVFVYIVCIVFYPHFPCFVAIRNVLIQNHFRFSIFHRRRIRFRFHSLAQSFKLFSNIWTTNMDGGSVRGYLSVCNTVSNGASNRNIFWLHPSLLFCLIPCFSADFSKNWMKTIFKRNQNVIPNFYSLKSRWNRQNGVLHIASNDAKRTSSSEWRRFASNNEPIKQ